METRQPQEPEAQPDISLEPLKLWVHDYQFPEANDDWDANWLNVTAQVAIPEEVWIRLSGPFLMTRELLRLRDDLDQMYRTLSGIAVLDTLEPEIKWTFRIESLGHIQSEVILKQHGHRHKVEIAVDQSYLPLLIEQIDSVLQRFPIRKTQEEL